ncbi:MAG: GxxExxY protein [Nitrospinota bacterium]
MPAKHTKNTEKKKEVNIIYPDESYTIIGACFNVYKDKGNGFLEPVYQECLEIEFDYQGIPFDTQKELPLIYRDKKLKKIYKPDFICFEKIIVEIKAVSNLIDEHRAQVLNYLNATKMKLGILVNFGHYPKIEYERLVLSEFK